MRHGLSPLKPLLVAATLGVLGPMAGCSCGAGVEDDGAGGASAGTNGGGSGTGTAQGGSTSAFMAGSGGSTSSGGCVNLECQQVACATPGTTTTVSGTVYDPSGTLPLYNVVVYVPNAGLDPVPDGLTCDQCDAGLSGSPLVSAITDTQGRFTLQNVPVGADIPLVMQVGKWRRQVLIPTVAECVDTPLPDPQMTRLPRSMAEGNLPRIALTTGNSDAFFCLLRRLGIEDTEYGIQGSAARIHFYEGANGSTGFDGGFGSSPGASFTNGPNTLWNDGWSDYDIVMLSCEGDEHPTEKNGRRPALLSYLDGGGRVFATHYHYNWFQGDAPAELSALATFDTNPNPYSFDELVDIDQTFPKGVALADWMDFVDGSSPYGQFFVNDGRRHNLTTDTTKARTWVTHDENGAPDVEYFSFNAPVNAMPDQQCGRMVFSDIHVSATAGDPNGDFPSACNNSALSEQEKALIFMLFDLSACIIPDDDPPCAPGQQTCGTPGDPVCAGTCVAGCCNVIPG